MKNILNKLLTSKTSKKSSITNQNIYSYLGATTPANWSSRNYNNFATEGYIKNVIANRCINIIAKGASSIDYQLFENINEQNREHKHHPLLSLLSNPSETIGSHEFFESLYISLLISGNCFIKIQRKGHTPSNDNLTLKILRADQVEILANENHNITGYKTIENQKEVVYPINIFSKKSQIIHIKLTNPLNDLYGLSPIECASYSIDQHNEASKWNQSLLQNSARPIGALVFKGDGENKHLTNEQYTRLKSQLHDEYMGASNSGKPILLEGGLEWKEIGLSPREMDFVDNKNANARDIALAFGIPPQMLGIPGDNTYNNMAEARLSMWEQTIIPMINLVISSLNIKLTHQYFSKSLTLTYDKNNIPALYTKREKIWNQINDAKFLSDDEKREMLGIRNNIKPNH